MGDNPDIGAADLFQMMLEILGILPEFLVPFEYLRMTRTGVRGNHDILLRVLSLVHRGKFAGFFFYIDRCFRMCDTGQGAEDHGGVEFLGNIERERGEFFSFAAVPRFEGGDTRELRVVPGILLVLRRVHPRIVGYYDDQPAGHPGVGQSHQRVGGDIQADMLHRTDGTHSGDRGPDRDFQRDLLVDAPFGTDIGIFLSDGFDDFGTRSTRIPGRDPDVCLIRAPGDSFISQHQFFYQGASSECFFELIL